jgi:hypothetical protein
MTHIVPTTGDDTETGGGHDMFDGSSHDSFPLGLTGGNDTLIGGADTDWLAGDSGDDRFDRVSPAVTQPPLHVGNVAFRALASNCC